MNKINHQISSILLHYRYIAKWYTVHTVSNNMWCSDISSENTFFRKVIRVVLSTQTFSLLLTHSDPNIIISWYFRYHVLPFRVNVWQLLLTDCMNRHRQPSLVTSPPCSHPVSYPPFQLVWSPTIVRCTNSLILYISLQLPFAFTIFIFNKHLTMRRHWVCLRPRQCYCNICCIWLFNDAVTAWTTYCRRIDLSVST